MTFEWRDLAKAVGVAAPIVGTVVGGPLGMAAGGLIAALCNEFGVDPNDPTAPAQLNKAILADPNAALKLKEFELTHKVELQKLLIRADEIAASDRADARARERAIVERTGRRDIALYLLAGLVTFGFFFLCGFLMYQTIPEGSNEVVFLLFGGLVAGFTQVMNYFFGSSKGSSDKTQIMAVQKQ